MSVLSLRRLRSRLWQSVFPSCPRRALLFVLPLVPAEQLQPHDAAEGSSTVKPSEYFMATAQVISSRPAKSSMIHSIFRSSYIITPVSPLL